MSLALPCDSCVTMRSMLVDERAIQFRGRLDHDHRFIPGAQPVELAAWRKASTYAERVDNTEVLFNSAS